MNIILITNENQIKYSLSHSFFPVGINIIHFKKCSDAVVQLNKVNPAVIIVDTDSELRTWKPLITVIRSSNKTKPIVFLLIMSNCDLETANQALYLGVNGVILKPFHKVRSIIKIVKLIKRHVDVEKRRSFIRIKPNIDDSVVFMYKDNVTRTLIKGQIANISANGVGIKLNMDYVDFSLEKGETLQNCILKIKGVEIRFDLNVIWYLSKSLGGRFINVNKQEFYPLYEYLLNKLSDIFQVRNWENDKYDAVNIIGMDEVSDKKEQTLEDIKKYYEDENQNDLEDLEDLEEL